MRLVVHIGGMRTACSSVQCGLARNETRLSSAAVYLPHVGRPEVPSDRVGHDLLAPKTGGPDAEVLARWEALAAELAGAKGRLALVSSALLEESARNPDARAVVDAGLAAVEAAGVGVTVLYVVREQLAQVNGRYVDRVAALTEVRPFAGYARQLFRSGALNLQRVFQPWYSGSLSFVAVPYPAAVDGDPLTNLLAAAGIDVRVEPVAPAEAAARPELGPVGVETFRLLTGHLRAVDPSFDPCSEPARTLAGLALERAKEAGWSDGGFWGWERQRAEHTARRLAAANRSFAHTVWGHPWPMPAPVGETCTARSLLHLPIPELDEVQRVSSSLVRAYLDLRNNGAPGSDDRSADEDPAVSDDPPGRGRRTAKQTEKQPERAAQ